MTALARQYVKLCDERDFSDPSLLAAIRSLVPERDPLAHIERKVWEFAMLMLFLEDVGRLAERTQALSVGAGNERVLFWLANRIGRIVATDIYGHGPFSAQEAETSMLTDPRSHAPYPYPEERLEVRWMDGRRLAFPDATFDVAFTISSIEHFGSPRDVSQAAHELGRVLRPGGHAVVITECLVRQHPLDRTPLDFAVRLLTLGRKRRRARPLRRTALAEMFTPGELISRIVRPSGLRLLQPLDLSLSPETWRHVTRAPTDAGSITSHGGHEPRVLLQAGRSQFTSVCLVLEKPAAPG